MLPRLLPFLPAALLLAGLSTASCSTKKNEPQAQPTTSASYSFDGQARTCQATQGTSSSAGYDFLTITLTTTPQPASGPESLSITLRKPTGQPASAYAYAPVGSILLQTAGLSQPYTIFHQSPLPTFTSSRVSGTFSGEVLASLSSGTVTTVHTVTAGSYANVPL